MKLKLLSICVFTTVMFGCKSGDDSKQNKDSIIVKPKVENVDNGEVLKLDETGFRTLIFDFKEKKDWKFEGDKPAIIDFYAKWCGPCKQLSPIVEKIAKEYAGKIRVYKVDVDEQQFIAAAFGVQSIPMLLFCPIEGKPQVTMGFIPESELRTIVKDVLKQ